MFPNCFRRLLSAAMILAALAAAGCGNDPSKLAVNKAEKAVEQFLDAWSRGEPADKFADPEQAIQGTDPDWKAGYRLISFLSADSQQSQDKPDHVRCRVAVSLQDKQGRSWDKQIVYDVQVSEKIVISRAAP